MGSPEFESVNPYRGPFQRAMYDYQGALSWRWNPFTIPANTLAQVLTANPLRHSIIWGPYYGSTLFVSTWPGLLGGSGGIYLGTSIPTTWTIHDEGAMVCATWYCYAFSTIGYLTVYEGYVLN